MAPVLCPFTDIEVLDYNPFTSFTYYRVEVEGQTFEYRIERNAFFEYGWPKDDWFQRNKYLVAAAMRNGLSLFEVEEIITLDLIRQRLKSSVIPHSPKMKLDGLLKYIDGNIPHPGSSWMFNPGTMGNKIMVNKILQKTYLKDFNELDFYLNTLVDQSHITLKRTSDTWYVNSTYSGLNYLISLEDQGHLSKNCFVAMSFADGRQAYRTSIETAIRSANYEPVLINTQHMDSDKTINDRIIAEIRACKFCVADFTDQRNGVYFEAGFALGLGKPVIYVCEKSDFEANSHFDLKPFQHILYSSADDLGKQLKAKIDAWIQ